MPNQLKSVKTVDAVRKLKKIVNICWFEHCFLLMKSQWFMGAVWWKFSNKACFCVDDLKSPYSQYYLPNKIINLLLVYSKGNDVYNRKYMLIWVCQILTSQMVQYSKYNLSWVNPRSIAFKGKILLSLSLLVSFSWN